VGRCKLAFFLSIWLSKRYPIGKVLFFFFFFWVKLATSFNSKTLFREIRLYFTRAFFSFFQLGLRESFGDGDWILFGGGVSVRMLCESLRNSGCFGGTIPW